MTDSVLLKERITQRGLKLSYIAQYMGLSRMGLYNKINNRRPFNQHEIESLCRLLQIQSAEEKVAIFFADIVDKYGSHKRNDTV